MTKQKTLLVTSIYARLWGTEFGGRSSREHHYKISLLNILNLNPDKVICFTSESELTDLENFFYTSNSVSKDILEFRIFDLTSSKYFDKIYKKKNLEEMKKFDRCFEIQYNKFFWVDDILELELFDKVYWFDAGLSHGGLFPDCFAYGNSFERNYQFNLFNTGFLNNLNTISDENFVLVCKNNTGAYYWSTSLPEKYYEKYCKDLHVVGGFFGGKPQDYKKVIKDFDKLLVNLLTNENTLYMEEQILSCLLYNNYDFFKVITFDDWYKKENYHENTKLFYEIFVTSEDCYESDAPQTLSPSVEIEKKNFDEIEIPIINYNSVIVSSCFDLSQINSTKTLINSVLEYTNFDFLLLTNYVDSFKEIKNERFKIINYLEFFDESINIQGYPNYHLTRHLIKITNKFNYDIIIFCKNNVLFTGWDDLSFDKFSNKNFDIAFVRSVEPQLGYLRGNFEHFKNMVDNELTTIYDDVCDGAPNPESYFFIIKNNEKIENFSNLWDEIYNNNSNRFATYYSGLYLGVLSVKSNMVQLPITLESKFSNYIKVNNNGNLNDFYGYKI